MRPKLSPSSCPGLTRASTSFFLRVAKTWMAGTSPAMTAERTLRRHRDRREVHEPALGLHESPDLRAHRAGPDVVRNIQKRGVVDGGRVQFGQRLVALGRIESLARFGHDLIEFGIIDKTPIIRHWRRHC